MAWYRAYQVSRDDGRHPPLEFESEDDVAAEAYVRAIIGPSEAAALYEGRRIVKLMRARPRSD